jgi:hypothetical protein
MTPLKGKDRLAHCGRTKRRNQRSPDATGKFNFQRHTVTILKQLEEVGRDEVVCNMAGWKKYRSPRLLHND